MRSRLSKEQAAQIISTLSPAKKREMMLAIKAKKKREEDRLKAAAIQSLAAFVRYMWPVVEPRRDLVWSWHMDEVCRFIEAIYDHDDETLRNRYDAENVDVAVCNIPPRCSKSTLFGVLGPAWRWLHEPGTQFLCLTKADKNAKRDARLMRQIIGSEKYQALLAETQHTWTLREDQNEVHYYVNTLGGHRISLTTQSALIGVGADFIIIDDPHDVEEVALGSPERVMRLMKEVSTKYEEVWKPRLNPPNGRCMLVMQRLNDADLAGHVHGIDAVRLVLPMEYEPENDLGWSLDPRTEPGELLVEERFTDRQITDMKRSPMKWAGQYQQRPTPLEGGTFRREWFGLTYRERPEDLAQRADEVWITLDAAGKGEASSDRSAIQVWARIGADWYLLWAYTDRVNLPELNSMMTVAIRRWGQYIRRSPGGILVEDAALGSAWLQISKGKIPYLIPWHPNSTPGKDKSKGARAMYLQRTAEAGNIHIPETQHGWLTPVVTDWFAFPNGVHDDHVDATSMLQVHFAQHGMRQVMQKAIQNVVFH